MSTILTDLGVDLAGAPNGLLEVGSSEICGVLSRGHIAIAEPDPVEERINRCFLDAHLAHIPAVLVENGVTIEGDPVLTVHRTRADGTYEAAYDSTRDAFGSGRWDIQVCERVTTTFPYAPGPPYHFVGLDCRDATSGGGLGAMGQMPKVPVWFRDRAVLPLCGIDVRIEDDGREGRECFADAVRAGAPAEFVYVSTGDEGEQAALWYRSFSEGRVEVIERQVPSPDIGSGSRRWLRHECSSAGITDEPGSEVDLLPLSHADTDCSVVEESAG